MNHRIMNSTPASPRRTSYIFASCKAWHRPLFDRIRADDSREWTYVSTTKELEAALSVHSPRYIFFLHWNWIVAENIWQSYECVCFHMTDVPFGRGGSPLQNLILAGHTQTMLTALRMVGEIDAGPVYTKRPLTLNGSAEEIYVRAGEISVAIIEWIIEHNPHPTPQEGEAHMFKRRKPQQSSLPTTGGLQSAYDFIRMLDAEGYPHAFVEHGDYKITFRNARLEPDRVIALVEIKI